VRGRAGKVLILSPQVMTAALVGWYVELAKLEPAFAAPGEHPEEALARVKPMLVVLIDGEFEEALSDLLAARAAKRGIGMALFSGGSLGTDDAARIWADRHHIHCFRLPVDLEAFGRVLDQASRTRHADRRGGDRRKPPAVERALDGTLMFFDSAGEPWYVYDRRAGERRFDGGEERRPYRSFISPDGLECRLELNDVEFAAREPAALVAQLARASQVPPNHSYP
jgi:hypothetical protein